MSKDRIFYWCQKVLPLTYDNSLSYYEVICKTFNYINDLIKQDTEFASDISEINELVAELERKINQWSTEGETFFKEFLDQWAEKHLATMIFVTISDAGYIVYNLPEVWKGIRFNTTGLDISTPLQPEYGHIVISY